MHARGGGLTAVVTTIREPTEPLREMDAAVRRAGGRMVAVADAKGPAAFPLEGALFLSFQEQSALPFSLAGLLPSGHYARKNLGYLHAMRVGADCIYETDDDNAPLPGWAPRPAGVAAVRAEPSPWLNVYRLFSDELIWPRGFPLGMVADPSTHRIAQEAEVRVDAPIQQGLADGSPDVDAVWRLVLGRDFRFRGGPSVWLPRGTWCPFNSQSTWWRPRAYPLMYLPSFCSFRMTDIWRSFVAQRCLWEMGAGLVFHGAEVVQRRNPHDLMRDFRDEVPGYLGNETIVRLLSGTPLREGDAAAGENLLRCYERLSGSGFFPAAELKLVEAWRNDVERLRAG